MDRPPVSLTLLTFDPSEPPACTGDYTCPHPCCEPVKAQRVREGVRPRALDAPWMPRPAKRVA